MRNSSLTTIVLQVDGADPIKVSEEIIPKINEAVRRSLPSVLNNLPEVAADFTGRVEEERTIGSGICAATTEAPHKRSRRGGIPQECRRLLQQARYVRAMD
jgi:hypothetical protein